ncbi:MAG: DegQ family serine endoprotease [Calditrichaeota bacterium]|nr:DegQ family serine endoprotease [Calditrichota bacterium]
MYRLKNSFALVAGLITIGVIIGVVLTTSFNLDSKSIAGTTEGKIYTEAQNSDITPPATAANFNPNSMFVDIVEKVRPSIVSIYTTKTIKMRENPFFFFFRDFGNIPEDQLRQPEMKQQGLGSGIIISKDGYILTNNHVVEDVDELRVKLIDNSEYDAKVIGTDPSTDIALIKIDAKDLPVAVLGNSDNLKIGEWVVAIGNPLNLTSTVTAGIVSALHRSINILRGRNNVSSIENFIQTDAAINPGNSGGALVNLKGEVIGVNTAIATNTNYYMGYGFAVPIDIAKAVVDDIIKFGEVRRGYLGVYISEVTPVTAKGVKLDHPRGVFVTSVIEGSAAEKAGIKEGDVILSVNGKEVNRPNELQAKIGVLNPGDKVTLKIWRDGKELTIKATLKGRDNEEGGSEAKSKTKMHKGIPDLGMKLRNLTDQQKDNLEVDGGALVASVEQFSAASQARIAPGDVIIEVEGKKVKSVSDFYDKVKKFKPGDVIKLKLRTLQNREKFDRLVFIEIPKK